METRTNYPHIDYRTQLQWANAGKIVNSDAIGVRMWSNGHRQRAFICFDPCDVHNGTDEELKIYFAPIRARQRNQRTAAQRRQLEKAQQEHAQQIKHARQSFVLSHFKMQKGVNNDRANPVAKQIERGKVKWQRNIISF